jgi:DNA-binding NarL/FixJ family response regulator
MGQNIVLAEPCELLRIGLRTIFAEDQRVSHIHETTTRSGLEAHICNHTVDLVVVNQSLLTNISSLPKGKFIILTSKLDLAILKAAYRHKCRGYLSENVSAELLRTVLDYNEGAFLIEPVFTAYVMDGFFGDSFSALKEELLTPREREIIDLLRRGLDRPTIAKTLCITETTLKTHIKNISRKRAI